ncbi:MAG: ATP-dependent zinc metalloprotease FtsH [Phycisphaerales bacterium]|nr:MAG: ATP-dependent zinc metalloprotease FtsH [Phycisphaerales bacterium]
MANTPNTPPDPSKRDNGQRPGGRPPAGQPPAGRGVFGFILVLLLVALLFMMFQGGGGGTQITLHEFREAWQNNEIVEDSVVVRESQVTARRRPGPDADSDRPTLVVINMNAADRMYVAGQIHEITGDRAQGQRPSAFMPLLYALLPVLLIVMILIFLFARAAKSAGAGAGMLGNFGKSKHRTLTKEMTGITFKDVAGIDEAKDEVGEIIEFLKNPKKFTKLGGRIPRGVLLTGPPGCGKTLLAKAIAGEADVPFFSISGSDFVEMFVGVGASRVRDLFKQAKESAPCIIFLDEIDAVGRKRGSGFSSGGNDEREQTLNAILVEMDGFNPSDGVIVIAATNRSEILDAALVRPGRFDRQIAVPLPDVKGRLEILRVHAKKVKLGPDVDLEKVAKITPMFSGADLAAAINEAAIAATMHDKDYIEQADIEEARDKIRFGRARKSRVREKEDNRLVAYHEAGHAVLQVLLPDSDPLHKVTIIPRGDAGGATFSLPDKDRMGYSLKWLRATMIMACGGRIAEEKAMGDMSSGASGDIAQITRIARTMISEWGMSESLGFVRYGWNEGESYMPEREYSDVTAELIDKEVRRIVEEAYREGERMLEDHWEQVVAVAEALLKYETLSRDEVEKLMRGEDLGKPTVSELLAREAKQAALKPEAKKPKPDEDTDMPPNVSPSPA